MNRISEEILAEITERIICERPEACYLGRREWNAVKIEFTRICTRQFYPLPDVGAAILYNGCHLFEVVSESHIGFSQPRKP